MLFRHVASQPLAGLSDVCYDNGGNLTCEAYQWIPNSQSKYLIPLRKMCLPSKAWKSDAGRGLMSRESRVVVEYAVIYYCDGVVSNRAVSDALGPPDGKRRSRQNVILFLRPTFRTSNKHCFKIVNLSFLILKNISISSLHYTRKTVFREHD